MIRLLYKDGQDWTDFNGKVTIMTTYDEKFKDSRIHPNFIAPLVLSDTWNGKTYDIQHTRWKGNYVEMTCDNDEVNEISRIQSCSFIKIIDLEQNIIHDIDTRTSEYLLFNEPERVIENANTWKVSFIYRTNRTVINKGASINNTNALYCELDNGSGVQSNTFYTDFEIVEKRVNDEKDYSTNESGVPYLKSSRAKTIKSAVFYLSNDDANSLIYLFENAQTITLNGVTVLGNSEVTSEEFGEALIKCVVDCITNVESLYPLAV